MEPPHEAADVVPLKMNILLPIWKMLWSTELLKMSSGDFTNFRVPNLDFISLINNSPSAEMLISAWFLDMEISLTRRSFCCALPSLILDLPLVLQM
jgi:hypothetical protein